MLIWLFWILISLLQLPKKVFSISVAGHHLMDQHLIHQLIQLLSMVKSPTKTQKSQKTFHLVNK